MTTERFTLRSAVYVSILKDQKILLMRRFQTGWRDGDYTLPAGHLDGGETVVDAMSRETLEETGITVKPEDLKVAHIMHHISDVEYIVFYLTTDKWEGTPEIKEPNKCDDMRWFSLNNLPENLLPNVRAALAHIEKGVFFLNLNKHLN